MPTQNIHVVQEVGTLEELYDQVAKLQKTLRYLLNGHLDFENIRAKGIIAETIDVDKLSAISADLGTITAGLMQAVKMIGSEIYGTYIATSEAGYPRAEMSSASLLFAARQSASESVVMTASSANTGSPSLTWRSAASFAESWVSSGGMFTLNGGSDVLIQTLDDLYLHGGNIYLRNLLGSIFVQAWSSLVNQSTGQSLQSEINTIYAVLAGKANAFSGFSGSFDTGDGRTANFSNGICTSVV